jgi:hypothetical protein
MGYILGGQLDVLGHVVVNSLSATFTATTVAVRRNVAQPLDAIG